MYFLVGKQVFECNVCSNICRFSILYFAIKNKAHCLIAFYVCPITIVNGLVYFGRSSHFKWATGICSWVQFRLYKEKIECSQPGHKTISQLHWHLILLINIEVSTWEVVWIWTNRNSLVTMVCSSYVDRVQVRRVDVGLLGCPCFHLHES